MSKKPIVPALSVPAREVPQVQKFTNKFRRDQATLKAENVKALKAASAKKVSSPNDFVNLVKSHTADQGACLAKILEDNLTNFIVQARKVFETLTQDVSDVLLNEQSQLVDFYTERKLIMTGNLNKYIEEILILIPDFDFELYFKDKEEYLKRVLLSPGKKEGDEDSSQKRASVRLHWLISEGQRLKAENLKLQHRLKQLKREKVQEQDLLQMQEDHLEETQVQLFNTEARMEQINENLLKNKFS